MEIKQLLTIIACIATAPISSGYSFVPTRSNQLQFNQHKSINNVQKSQRNSRSTQLKMIDSNVIQGAAIALAGLGAGIGMVVFTESQGERAKERGSNLSDSMTTKLAGQMMEDVEVSSVSDISSLTSQLEAALKETGGAKEEELELTGKYTADD